jgi:shikimate dehydrogenase
VLPRWRSTTRTPPRRDALAERLRERFGTKVRTGSSDPTGCMLVVNATPVGMRAADPYPVQVEKLTRQMFVGDVITAPAVTPLIEAARRVGCATQVGGGMFAVVLESMVGFLLDAGPLAR